MYNLFWLNKIRQIGQSQYFCTVSGLDEDNHGCAAELHLTSLLLHVVRKVASESESKTMNQYVTKAWLWQGEAYCHFCWNYKYPDSLEHVYIWKSVKFQDTWFCYCLATKLEDIMPGRKVYFRKGKSRKEPGRLSTCNLHANTFYTILCYARLVV